MIWIYIFISLNKRLSIKLKYIWIYIYLKEENTNLFRISFIEKFETRFSIYALSGFIIDIFSKICKILNWPKGVKYFGQLPFKYIV